MAKKMLKRDKWRLLVEFIPPGAKGSVSEESVYTSFVRARKAYSSRLRELWTHKYAGKGVVKDFRIAVCEIRKVEWQSPALHCAEGCFGEEGMAGVVMQIKEKVAGLRALTK